MSQGHRIMADIKRIRAALATPGQGSYRLQKLPRQAVWLLHCRNSKTYRLTFQPAPINAWTLHPPDREASALVGKIEQALRPSTASAGESVQSYPRDAVSEQEPYRLESQQFSSSAAYEGEAPTAYNQLLHPWCVVQFLPHMQRRTVARFRRRNDADAHLTALRRLSPSAQYIVVFDPTPPNPWFTPKKIGEILGVSAQSGTNLLGSDQKLGVRSQEDTSFWLLTPEFLVAILSRLTLIPNSCLKTIKSSCFFPNVYWDDYFQSLA